MRPYVTSPARSFSSEAPTTRDLAPLLLIALTLVFLYRLAFSDFDPRARRHFAYFYPYWQVRNAAC